MTRFLALKKVLERAARDLASLYERISAEDSIAAAKWFNGLETAIYSLSELPRRCPMAPESKKAKRPLRSLLDGNKPHIYRAVYEIDEISEAVRRLDSKPDREDLLHHLGVRTGMKVHL